MSTDHIDFIFMTIKSKNLRVAVGNKAGADSIVFTYPLEANMQMNFCNSYRVYLNALTEAEGRDLQQLVDKKQLQMAEDFLFKTIKRDQSLGPCGLVQMSDQIPDEWFNGCKWAMAMLDCQKVEGVFAMDFDEEGLAMPGERIWRE